MWGWATEDYLSPECTDYRPASHWNGIYKRHIWLRMWDWATWRLFITGRHWFKANLTLEWYLRMTDLSQKVRLGHWRLFLSLVCTDFRPASHLWATYRQQTWLRMWGWATKGFFITSNVRMRWFQASLTFEWYYRRQTWLRMWGWATEGFLSLACTDSRPGSHLWATYRAQTWFRMWGWATEGFFITSMHWFKSSLTLIFVSYIQRTDLT